jgi:hypothetical protein
LHPSRFEILSENEETNKPVDKKCYNPVYMKSERGRGKPENIPGVRKGFQKGESMETGREWAAGRIRAEMTSQKVELLIIETSKESFLDLPIIGPSNPRHLPGWMPRYERDTGAIITTRWGKGAAKITEEGKKALIEPERFSVINKPRYVKSVDLTSFPKSWSVSRLIPQRIEDGIEAAMRQQDEVRSDYQGVEQDKVAGLLIEIHQLTELFLQKGVSEYELNEVVLKTSEIVEDLGISKTKGNIYQRLINSMNRAGRKDRLGRVNPLISRTLLRSAYLDSVKREVQTRLSREKANNVYNLLFVERFTTRALLENAKESIEKLAGLGRQPGHEVLTESYYRRNPAKNIKDIEITGLRQDLKAIAETSLRPVRVAPYLIIARLSEVMLLSPLYMKRRDRVVLEAALMNTNWESMLGEASVEEHLMKRDPESAVRRLRQIHTLIDEELTNPDNFVYTVFD